MPAITTCSGEVIVGGKKVLFMDEISTGLDSATTFLITKCLSNFCHIMEGTLLVALLQPPPETYNLFDDVMLLSQGQIVFHGPREEVSSSAVHSSLHDLSLGLKSLMCIMHVCPAFQGILTQ